MGVAEPIVEAAEKSLGGTVSEGVIPGRVANSQKRKGAPFQNVEVRYFVATLSDDGDRAVLESLMTTGLRCGGELLYPGDVVVVQEESTFDKEQGPVVMIKYMTIPADTVVA